VDRARQTQALPPQLLLLPSREMTRVISFGNELLLAQLIFYSSMFYVGSLERPPTTASSRELYRTLDTVTYLDPYNMDGYYFAQGLMSWNISLIEPLNSLLRRGMAHRPWDWHLPFFYGFNQFFFLKKPEEGARYFKKAYQLNPRNTFLPTLIARLHYEADETEVAIEFLEEMIRAATSQKLRKWMAVRLQALRSVSLLEDATRRYREKYESEPRNLGMLVEGGIIEAIPADPYGGEFYLDQKGRVRTTSKFAYGRKKSSTGGQ
jgi:tetratricopeptide (TPR) repeat protein